MTGLDHVLSDKTYSFIRVNEDSFCSRALFAGRKVTRDAVAIWKEIHLSAQQTSGLIGAAFGAAGGALFKAGMDTLGLGARTRPLSDYAVKSAQTGYKVLSELANLTFVPVTGAAALAFSAAGVVGAAIGTTLSVVAAPVYKMAKHALGEDVQGKRVSDFVICSAELGAKIAMILSVVAVVAAGFIFCPWATIFSLFCVSLAGLSHLYVMAEPVWLDAKIQL